MPLYEYSCRNCEQHFELLIRGSERAECPSCASTKLERLLSAVAAPGSGGRELPQSRPSPAGGCGLPQCGAGACGFE
jgi:putative FmdB family regulatory protein